MSLPAIPPIGSQTAAVTQRPTAEAVPGGFGAMLRQGLEGVSGMERAADAAATGFATGDGTKVHDVMAAGAKSQVAVDLLTQVRNRAVETYTEIMRLQV